MNDDEQPVTQDAEPSAIPHQPFDLYVFDLDGTLIDSRRDLADAVNALLVECGAGVLPENSVVRMVGDGAATLVARAFAAATAPQPPDALIRFLAIYDRHLTDHTRSYEGIPEALQRLAAHSTLAVLTNKPLPATRTILERLELARFFHPSFVCGGDGPLPRKPDPAGLQELMRRAGASPGRTLMVGDSLIDWRTARAAGTGVCMVRYGFGFEGFPAGTLSSVDLAVDHPSGLSRL
jgi:phosphoglycolate phosphatase